VKNFQKLNYYIPEIRLKKLKLSQKLFNCQTVGNLMKIF